MPPNQLTQAQLISAVERALPEGYLEPMRAVEGGGFEIIQAHAKVGERTSLAVGRFESDGYIVSSEGGVRATVPATFYRPTADAGAGTMLTGTVVRASLTGPAYRTLDDAEFGALDLEVTVDALAIGYGYEFNIKGPFVDPQGTSWPGELDTIDLPLMEPAYWDPTIQVRNDADADGLGRPATLDAIGAERSVKRQNTEADENYRVRIRELPDTVSPAAIARQLTNFFRPYGFTWRTVETWQHQYQECYDAPEVGPDPDILDEPYDQFLFVYDDFAPESPFNDRWLDETSYLGAFIVEIIGPEWIDDYGFAWDDPAESLAELDSDAGRRAISVFDAPDSLEVDIALPAFDAFDLGFNALVAELFAMLDDIKLGGVYFAIVVTPAP